MRRTLVIIYHVAQVVSAAVVCLAHRHGVVREVDIAVIAFICGSLEQGDMEPERVGFGSRRGLTEDYGQMR